MSILSSKLDKLFILLVPVLVVGIFGAFNCPSEPDFVQTFLSIMSNSVIPMIVPLVHNPNA
jgi:hypothetical protein